MKVIKRDGSIEPLTLDKIHRMCEFSCEDLAGVSASQIEMNANLQFFDGIKSSEIQQILIRSASDLISTETPNYQYVAARLLLFDIRREVFPGWADETGYTHLKDHIEKCVEDGVYDSSIIDKYSEGEWNLINGFIDHQRDYGFTFAGLRQIVDKYLVQDRSTGTLYETPQYMYIMVAATLFQNYPTETRLDYVRRYYTATSKGKINIPTPVLAGVRTPIRQFASCVLVDAMTPSIVSLAAIWLLANMSLKGQELVSTQVGSGVSTLKSGVEKFSTQVLSPSLKSSKVLLDVVLRTVLEVGQRQSTSPSGTKK